MVAWSWTTVLCLLYLVIVFSFVGLISLATGLIMKSIRACRSEAARKDLWLITIIWLYTSLQVTSAVLGYLAVGGSLLISENNQQDKPNEWTPKIDYTICWVIIGLQLLWLSGQRIFKDNISELFSFMFIQFVDPKILEMKTQDLKIKINYPLFLKKSKSNMFQKALREDFESQGLKKDKTNPSKNDTKKEEPQIKQSEANLRLLEKLKQQLSKQQKANAPSQKPVANPSTAKENFLSSGGFYSSRGGPNEKPSFSNSNEMAGGNRFALGKNDQLMIKEHFNAPGLRNDSEFASERKPQQNRRVLVQSASKLIFTSRRW